MIVVGPKFILVNGDHVPIGVWIIVLQTLIGAILTGKSYHMILAMNTLRMMCVLCAVFIRPELRKTKIDRKKTFASVDINKEEKT